MSTANTTNTVYFTDALRRAIFSGRLPRFADTTRAYELATREMRTADFCAAEAERVRMRETVAQLTELRESIRGLRASMPTGFAQVIREALTGVHDEATK